jgi:STAS domain
MGAPAGGEVVPRLVFAGSGTIRGQDDDGHVTLSIAGVLDGATGAALLEALEHELLASPNRIDVELCGVDSFDADGVRALGRCRELCANVSAGLHFRMAGGPGQQALLEAFESEPVAEVD